MVDKITWESRRVKIDALQPADYNPRHITDKQLDRLKEN